MMNCNFVVYLTVGLVLLHSSSPFWIIMISSAFAHSFKNREGDESSGGAHKNELNKSSAPTGNQITRVTEDPTLMQLLKHLLSVSRQRTIVKDSLFSTCRWWWHKATILGEKTDKSLALLASSASLLIRLGCAFSLLILECFGVEKNWGFFRCVQSSNPSYDAVLKNIQRMHNRISYVLLKCSGFFSSRVLNSAK